jgi:hypothetical protein
MVVVLRLLKVVCHLHPRVVVSTFDIERFILRATIEDILVAADILAD